MSAANELNPTARFLMGPGPSDVHPRVLKAMATPLIGHLDPQFIGRPLNLYFRDSSLKEPLF